MLFLLSHLTFPLADEMIAFTLDSSCSLPLSALKQFRPLKITSLHFKHVRVLNRADVPFF